jgi:hypothetical protein
MQNLDGLDTGKFCFTLLRIQEENVSSSLEQENKHVGLLQFTEHDMLHGALLWNKLSPLPEQRSFLASLGKAVPVFN